MSINDEYVLWLHRIEPHACGLRPPEGFEDVWLLQEGGALAGSWPSDVVMPMNPDNPADMRLTDSLFNISSLLVLSERAADFLAGKGLEHLELLPIGVRDHKGKLVDARHFVLNLSAHEPLLDPQRSDAQPALVPGEYRAVNAGIVLLENAEDRPPPLFRLQGFGIPTLVSRELAAEIDAQGFSGIAWGELTAFRDRTW